MEKLFINTIIQHGGISTNHELITALNIIFTQINNKMKKLEYKHAIKLKLPQLPTNNWDCIPMTVGVDTMIQVNGPLKGQIPMYMNTQIAIPTPVIAPVPVPVPMTAPLITPGGLGMGVGMGVGMGMGMGLDFSSSATKIENRVKRAEEYLIIIAKIDSDLSSPDLDKSKVDKKYFDFVDFGDEKSIDKLKKILGESDEKSIDKLKKLFGDSDDSPTWSDL